MGVAMAALALGGGVVNALGQYQAGQSKSAADSYRAQVADNNAAIAKQNSILDIQSGETASFNQGMKTRAKVGAEKAQQGASGIDVNTGSAPQVRAGTEELGMLDALTIRSNAAKQAYGQQVQASNYTAESELDRAQSSQDAMSGVLGGVGTLLSSASTAGGQWARFQNSYGGTG